MELTLNLPYRVRNVVNNEENKTINFSIAILTRNNENEIDILLNNLQDFINDGGEIVILDLNSTDKTLEVASNRGVRVENGAHFIRTIDDDMLTFINDNFNRGDSLPILEKDSLYIDFGGAREYLQSLPSNNMILMIDPKTEIYAFDFNEIKNNIVGFNRIHFTVHNKKNVYEFYNRTEYKWNGIIDEYLSPYAQENVRQLSHNVLQLSNVNYTDEIEDYQYHGLLINCYLNGDEHLIKKLASIFYSKSLINASFNLYNKHLELCTDAFQRSNTLCCMAQCNMDLNNPNAAIEYYHKAYMEFGEWRSPLYQIAQHYYFVGDYKRCVVYAEGCLKIDKPDFNTDEPEIYYQDGLYSMLYVAYWWLNNPKKGKYYFDKALEISPYNPVYLSETGYHYDYLGSSIHGYLSFKDTQILFNEAKKYKSILEIYPDSPRGTHALTYGCDGMVTVICKEIDEHTFRTNCNYPGNLRYLNMNTFDALNYLKDEKFDMVILHNRYEDIINDNNIYLGIYPFEEKATKLICGTKYKENAEIIDKDIEVHDVIDHIWKTNISSFEKTIIYTKKIL